MFPKITRSRDQNLSIVTVKYLNETIGLQIDESRCQGCGTCVKICPTNALERGPIGGTLKKTFDKSVSTVVSPETCSYCGLCSYMCPWTAISLMKNGEKIALENLELVKKKAVPELVIQLKKCKDTIPKARSYLEGKLEITTENCPGGCNTCIDVCPTGALSVEKSNQPWEKGRKILVDEDKCILCGVCTNSCPVDDAIHLNITKVNFKGDYQAILWDKTIERLKTSRMREGERMN
ncbi:MAG: 4Fe-4S binding protein [Candidatus Lokiarchaeota archaeon]|nr:4Fe-4S binding protein [Candidatus Lokiarchaeota archaeon]